MCPFSSPSFSLVFKAVITASIYSPELHFSPTFYGSECTVGINIYTKFTIIETAKPFQRYKSENGFAIYLTVRYMHKCMRYVPCGTRIYIISHLRSRYIEFAKQIYRIAEQYIAIKGIAPTRNLQISSINPSRLRLPKLLTPHS